MHLEIGPGGMKVCSLLRIVQTMVNGVRVVYGVRTVCLCLCTLPLRVCLCLFTLSLGVIGRLCSVIMALLGHLLSRKHTYIILTPLNPNFISWNWGLQGYTFFFLFLSKNIDCGYSLEPPRRGGSNEYPQSVLWAEGWKISEFLSENFPFLEVKSSVYLNRHVFVMFTIYKCFFFFFFFFYRFCFRVKGKGGIWG